jgi:hypothetical protein
LAILKIKIRKPIDKEKRKYRRTQIPSKSLLRPSDFSDAFFKVARVSSFCFSNLAT